MAALNIPGIQRDVNGDVRDSPVDEEDYANQGGIEFG